MPRFVGTAPRHCERRGWRDLEVEISLETAPSVVFDALALPDGDAAALELAKDRPGVEFVKDTYRHCKPILAMGAGKRLLEAAQLPPSLPNGKPDPGLLVADSPEQGVHQFIEAIAKHRHWERQTDPPRI